MANDSEIEHEKELIERAKLLFDFQKEQYEVAVDGYRRLEDKLQKLFGVLSIVITTVVLIIRYWYKDIFPGVYEPMHAFCQLFLFAFMILVMVAWGFTFSGMQPRVLERPDSSNKLTKFFMETLRKNALTAYAQEYSRLTDVIDTLHAEKVGIMKKCSEAMLFSILAFVVFIISFVILKSQFKDDSWLKNQETLKEMHQRELLENRTKDLTTLVMQKPVKLNMNQRLEYLLEKK